MKTPTIFTSMGLLDKKYFYKFTRNWDDDCIEQEGGGGKKIIIIISREEK